MQKDDFVNILKDFQNEIKSDFLTFGNDLKKEIKGDMKSDFLTFGDRLKKDIKKDFKIEIKNEVEKAIEASEGRLVKLILSLRKEMKGEMSQVKEEMKQIERNTGAMFEHVTKDIIGAINESLQEIPNIMQDNTKNSILAQENKSEIKVINYFVKSSLIPRLEKVEEKVFV